MFRRDSAPQQWKNRALLCASKAGLVNNLNDGLAWGLRFPRPVALTNQLSSQALFGGIALVGRAGLPTAQEADDHHWNGSFQPAPFPEYPRNEK